MKDLRARLAHLLETGGPTLKPLPPGELVIYGAGNAGRTLSAIARSRGFMIRCFLDERANSIPELDDEACHLPESAAAHAAAAAGIPVVVAVFNYAADVRPILSRLRNIGFARIITFYEIHEHLGYEPQFWLGNRSSYPARAPEILAGFDLFEDETSHQIYYDHIALRLTFDTTLLTEPDQGGHYLPLGLPRSRSAFRVIDGGAFNGDTIQSLFRRGLHVDAIAAFEPDPANFRQLRKALDEVNGKLGEAILFPCGLSNETMIRSFSGGEGTASVLHDAGGTYVQVVALDDVLPAFAPTFIKLDIEGAEPEALLGAQQMITRHQPTLAVCVYHAPEHLWTLPALVRRLWPGYRLALRYHQFNGFDVVLYAFAR